MTKANPIVILLIDDQAIIGEAIRRLLAPETDIVFHFCQDPTQALEIAINVSPTVILQDIVMPDLDGYLLIRYFRAHAKTRSIPLIVLSSKDDPEIKAKVLELGANDYLIKVPSKDILLQKIRFYANR